MTSCDDCSNSIDNSEVTNLDKYYSRSSSIPSNEKIQFSRRITYPSMMGERSERMKIERMGSERMGSERIGTERELYVTSQSNDHDNRLVYKLQSFVKRRGCKSLCRCIERVDNSGTLSPIERYLFWVFHSSFIFLFLKFTIIYTLFVTSFSLLIWWTGSTYESCVDPTFMNKTYIQEFSYSYQLSWTTFSTVGYGKVTPIGSNQSVCVAVSLVCSFESFVGIIFSSFCGATIFAKVTRIQAVAPIVFSDPLLIRFGNVNNPIDQYGVEETPESSTRSIFKDDQILCPIMEFRIINVNYHKTGGEIVHASIHGAGNVSAKQAPAFNTHKMTNIKKRKSHDPKNYELSERDGHDSWNISTRRKSNFTSISQSTRSYLSGTSSSDPTFISKRIVPARLKFHTFEFPFFKRVWVVQHALDENSPLLSATTRKIIHDNQGCWPKHLYNPEYVSKSLKFEEIIINFSGTSNATGAPIYLQKTYDLSDVNIGFRFANILYRDQHGLISLDLSKINDVNPQAGNDKVYESEVDIL